MQPIYSYNWNFFYSQLSLYLHCIAQNQLVHNIRSYSTLIMPTIGRKFKQFQFPLITYTKLCFHSRFIFPYVKCFILRLLSKDGNTHQAFQRDSFDSEHSSFEFNESYGHHGIYNQYQNLLINRAPFQCHYQMQSIICICYISWKK